MAGGALDDLRVLEISDSVAGDFCGLLLAGLGAEVVKIEPPHGSPLRRSGPFPADCPHPEASGLFLHLNRGKKGITLDLGTATGRALVLRLVSLADALVTTSPPLPGLDRADLLRRNPALLLCTLTPYGREGPEGDAPACDLTLQARGGFLHLTGERDGPPLKVGGFPAEYQGGLAGALALLSALARRDRTGEGEILDASLLEALVHTFDGSALFPLTQAGEALRRSGARLPYRDPRFPYPSTLLPCRDGWVHASWSPALPDGLSLLTGDPHLADPEVLHQPTAYADEIDARLAEWLRGKTREEVMERAQELRLPFTAVQTVSEALEDPQNRATGFFVPIPHPAAGTYRYPRLPFRGMEKPGEACRAPLLGEHNREVYCDLLGLEPGALPRLRAIGVI